MYLKYVPVSDYTIGWVCALPIELAAASGMMDEEYARLPPQPNDSNIYSYGRIGGHNIVMACLPAGQTGTNSAATVASQMKTSFPAVRFGVLVGIGGGVPNLEDDKDIRLGDVVISQPFGEHGGVIQYDFGKTGADGRLARTGSLNAPPTILLNALSQLQANKILDKMKFQEYLSELLAIKPKFASPGPEKDVLYEADSQHLGRATCKKCRPEDEVDREDRMTTEPVLFFGNIASGNQVMRDGQTRDRHSQELGGVLCFEMEAAGLMNNFPCLVIRGICDYADAHKNKQWQSYAAATAAALAKELLCTIPSTASTARQAIMDPIQKPHFVVPFGRNENFVGRRDILGQLLQRIPPTASKYACQRTAIIGPTGIGKTQVAIEAAYRVLDAYPDCSVFWVSATSVAVLGNHYRKIGKSLELEDIDSDVANVRILVKEALERDDINEWLLIIDNADDVDFSSTRSGLASYIPKSRKGSILLNKRNSVAAARHDDTVALHLSEMDTEEGVELLHSGLAESQIEQDQSTIQLVERLAHLPLAIRQASAYLRANQSISITQYLDHCGTASEEEYEPFGNPLDDDQDRCETIKEPVMTTWRGSFEDIVSYYPLAAKCLSCMCLLAKEDIPVTLLPLGDNDEQTREAINILLAYAFIQQREGGESFDVHQLVRCLMRTWLVLKDDEEKEEEKEDRELKQLATETIARLSAEFPQPKATVGSQWSYYIPHAEAALQACRVSTNEKPLWDLLSKVGEGKRLLGNYKEAMMIHMMVLQLKQDVLGEADPELMESWSQMNWAMEIAELGGDDDSETGREQAGRTLAQQAAEFQLALSRGFFGNMSFGG